MVKPTKQTETARGLTFDQFREMALSLPGVDEASSYGTPGFKVRRKFLSRYRPEMGAVVVPLDFESRDFLMNAEPGTFFITPHYKDWPAVLVHLANVQPEMLRELLTDAWRGVAPKKLLADYQEAPPEG